MTPSKKLSVSVMLAVADVPAAIEWYKRALGATVLWSLGPIVGLEIAGAPFFLGEPANNGWESPSKLGITSARVEVFCDDPDTVIAHALDAHWAAWTMSGITTRLGESIGKDILSIRLGTFGLWG